MRQQKEHECADNENVKFSFSKLICTQMRTFSVLLKWRAAPRKSLIGSTLQLDKSTLLLTQLNNTCPQLWTIFWGCLFFFGIIHTPAFFRIQFIPRTTRLLIDLVSRVCHRHRQQELLYVTHLTGMIASTMPEKCLCHKQPKNCSRLQDFPSSAPYSPSPKLKKN